MTAYIDPLASRETYEYNEQDELTQKNLRDGKAFRFEYETGRNKELPEESATAVLRLCN